MSESDLTVHAPELPEGAPGWQRAAHRIAYHPAVQTVIVAVIVLNAIVIGAQTYDRLPDLVARVLDLCDQVFLAILVVELALRFVAYGCRPVRFFRSGWNSFDTVVTLVAFVPLVSGNSTVLRVVRVLRVARLAKVMPDIGVLLDGLRRVARPAATLLALTALMCFLYGMVGYFLFGETTGQYFGNIGRAMLTLFELLTLEGWNTILHTLIADAGVIGLIYTISFVIVGTYIVINLMVAVVIASLDEAHKERIRQRGSRTAELRTALSEMTALVERMEHRLNELDAGTGAKEAERGDDR